MIFAELLLLGCWTYCALSMVAAVQYRRKSRVPPASGERTAISILKPLSGLDEGLEANLRSYFEQDCDELELLFAVGNVDEPAAEVVRGLQREFPRLEARIVVTGEAPYPHDKVFKLQRMLELAKHELVVMSDSDVRVGRDFCRHMAAEFQHKSLGLLTCPYRAVAGHDLWSRLEATSMNTDFHAGLFTAVLLEGTKFAVGPTIAARRQTLIALGGMERFKDYLSSEDFMLGRTAAEEGVGVRMSSYVVEHRIGSQTMRQNFSHRLRWARTTRRSRPWGYVGQFFTYPASAVVCICFAWPLWKPLLLITSVLRVTSAFVISERTLGAPIPWPLLPLQDLLTFGFWVAGFFGRTVHWRGRRYVLQRDGTLQPAG